MLIDRVRAVNALLPFDILIENVNAVNVFNDSVSLCDIGIVGEYIVYVGKAENHDARRIINGGGCFALPGFFDSHMHLESSMLCPESFAMTVLRFGTTSIVADPHEIYNVLGEKGVSAMIEETAQLPLHTHIMAPSTVPSLPGFEGSGAVMDAQNAAQLLDLSGITGLGEVMDFNGVADGDAKILAVIEEGIRRGAIIDGHASLLTGRRLQAFRAAGIDSDHTTSSADKLREELALGFTVQIQECMLSEEMTSAMNEVPVSDRICLVTDDVPITKLMRNGHLNHVVTKAIELGLEPLRAIRFATINPAVRSRIYDTGAIAPGMRADIQLVNDLRKPLAHTVLSDGKIIYEQDRAIYHQAAGRLAEKLENAMNISERVEADFCLPCPQEASVEAVKVNVISQNGVNIRTKRRIVTLPVRKSACCSYIDYTGLIKMAVFNRYGVNTKGLALIDGLEGFKGAVALTYGHDCHNLSVFGSSDKDMTIAANAVIRAHGGICLAAEGKILSLIELPVAGLLSLLPPQQLLERFDEFIQKCRECGFTHKNPLVFFTQMPLAVSPEIKCTDRGLLDVKNKCFLPLVEQIIKRGENADETD